MIFYFMSNYSLCFERFILPKPFSLYQSVFHQQLMNIDKQLMKALLHLYVSLCAT